MADGDSKVGPIVVVSQRPPESNFLDDLLRQGKAFPWALLTSSASVDGPALGARTMGRIIISILNHVPAQGVMAGYLGWPETPFELDGVAFPERTALSNHDSFDEGADFVSGDMMTLHPKKVD